MTWQHTNQSKARRIVVGIIFCASFGLVGCERSGTGKGPADSRGANAGERGHGSGEAGSSPDANPGPQDPKPDYPKAETLLAKHVEAAGGAQALGNFRSAYFEGKIDTGQQNMDGTAKLWWKPGRFYLEESIEGVGTTRAGYDGQTVWTEDPVSGLRRLEGKEAEGYIRSSSLFLCHDWKEFFERAETRGEADVDGKPAWQVELTSPLDQHVTMSFDKESGLLTKMQFKQIGPTGEVPVLAFPTDYREVEGYKIAHAQRSEIPPLFKFEQTYEKIEVNVDLDDSKFTMPGSDAVVPADPAKQGESKAAPKPENGG